MLELSHEIHMALRIGGPISTVSSQVRASGIATTEVEDIANILMSHTDGGLTSLSLNMIEQPPSRVWTAIGAGGRIELDLLEGRLVVSRSLDHTTRTSTEKVSSDDLYRLQLMELIALGTNGGAPSVTLDEGIQCLEVCLDVTGTALAQTEEEA